MKTPLLIVLILLILSPMYSINVSSQIDINLVVAPTNVYNMIYGIPMHGDLSMRLTVANYLGGYIAIAGDNYVALVDPVSMSVLWSEHIVGTATSMGADSSSPKWVIVGTDTGEITAFNLETGDRIDYFTAQHSRVIQVYSSKTGGEYKFMATVAGRTDSNYLYLYDPESPYWSLIGPDTGDGPMTKFSGVGVAWAIPLRVYSNSVEYRYDSSHILVSLIDAGAFTGSVTAMVYYNNTDTLTIDPALPGNETLEDLVRVKTLKYYLLYNNAVIASGSGGTEEIGNQLYIQGIYPTVQYKLVVIYTIKLVDNETETIVDSRCYYGVEEFSIDANEELDLGNIILEPGGRITTECISRIGFDPQVRINVNPVLKVDAREVPHRLDLGRDILFRIVPIPYPDVTRFHDTVFDLVKPYIRPQGFGSAEAILATASPTGDRVFIYLLDGNLNPVAYPNKGMYVETINVEDRASMVKISSDGMRIFIGTESGRLIMLEWSKSLGRYIEKDSMKISTTPITGVDQVDGYLVVTASDGATQLIDIKKWVPLWRGAPGYHALTPEFAGEYYTLLYADDKVLYAYSSNSLVKFMHGLKVYNPVLLMVNATLYTVDGASQYEDSIEVYALYNGNKVLSTRSSTGGQVIVYTPSLPIDLYIDLDGIGSIKLENIESRFPYTLRELNIALRKIDFTIYTPESIGDASRDPGYKLVAGPQEGVSLTASYKRQTLYLSTYEILNHTVKQVTDDNGKASFILFDGAVYDVSISKPEFSPKTVSLQSRGPALMVVAIHPILYETKLALYDLDAMNHGAYYTINGSVELTLLDRGTSVVVGIGAEGSTYYLPRGLYKVLASAPHYLQSETTVSVPGRSISIGLNPELYTVTIQPYGYDEVLGIEDLYLYNSSLRIKLEHPYTSEPITLKPGDPVTLRYGKYAIEVIDWVTSYTKTVNVNGTGVISIYGELYYSNVDLDLKDKEIQNFTITNNIIIDIEYSYGEYVIHRTININDTTIKLPYGNYTITLYRLGYEPTSITIIIGAPESTITKTLEPRLIQFTLEVSYKDELTGIAQGGVPSVLIELELLNPPVEGIKYTLYTGDDGTVQGVIREGLYRVKVSSPLIQGKETIVKALGSEEPYTIIYVEPRYANLTIVAMDGEVPVRLPGASIEVTRLGPGEEKTISITTASGEEELILPLGRYVVTGSMPSRYHPTSVDVNLITDTRITLRLEPIKIGLTIVAVSEDAKILYNGREYLLPKGVVNDTLVRLVPADPLLVALGIQPIEAIAGGEGGIVAEVRPGTYIVVGIKDGYRGVPVTVQIMPETGIVEAPMVPLLHKWVFDIRDAELLEEYSAVEAGSLRVLTYNGLGTNVVIDYRSGTEILMPTGLYNITIEKNGYTGLVSTLRVMDDGNATLYVVAEKIGVNIELTALVSGERVNVEFGVIVAEALNLPLKDSTIEFNLTNGNANLQLRRGDYSLYYTIPGLTYKWELGSITVTEQSRIKAEIEVEKVPVEIRIVDAEYTDIGIAEALVDIMYRGPFGEDHQTLEYKQGFTDKIVLLPGVLTIAASTEYYYDFLGNFTVGPGQNTVTIKMEPVVNSVVISFVNPDGGEIKEDLEVTLRHKIVPYEVKLVSSESSIYLRDIRSGAYTLIVEPVKKDSLYRRTVINLTITEVGEVDPQPVTVNYRLFNVTIIMIEKEIGQQVKVKYNITIDRKGEASDRLGFPLEVEITGRTSVSLPPGSYSIRVKPVALDVYTPPPQITFSVPELTTIIIPMTPKTFPITIIVTDDRERPMEGAFIAISNVNGTIVASGYTDATGKYSTQLRFGAYTITAKKDGYKDGVAAIQVPIETSKSITLEAEMITKIRRIAPLIIGVTGILILASVLYIMRERLARRILEEEEYF